MSLIVMSNVGTWNRDNIGVVGSIAKEDEILLFVQEYGLYTDEQIEDAKMYSGDEALQQIWDENEFHLYSQGATVLLVEIEDDYYFVEQF